MSYLLQLDSLSALTFCWDSFPTKTSSLRHWNFAFISPSLLQHNALHSFCNKDVGDKVRWKSYNWWCFTGHTCMHVDTHTQRHPTTPHLVLHNLTCWYIIKTANTTVTINKLLRLNGMNIWRIPSISITRVPLLLFQDHWTIFVIICVCVELCIIFHGSLPWIGPEDWGACNPK